MRWGRPWGAGSEWGADTDTLVQNLNLFQSRISGRLVPAGTTIKELIESRNLSDSGDGRELTRIFIITGTDDPVQASGLGPQKIDIYKGNVGDSGDTFTDSSLIVVDRSLIPIAVDTPTPAIRLEVKYQEVRLTQKQGVNRQVSLEISAKTTHIEQGFGQVHYPISKRQDQEKKFDDLIGPITPDKKLKGVDRIDTAMALNETHFRGRLSQSYINMLADLHTKVNKSTFRGFAPKRVLFHGVRANRIANGEWQLDFRFVVGAALVNKEITFRIDKSTTERNDIQIVGHEFLWIETGQFDKDNVLLRSILSAHVTTVYELAEFSALDIGTSPLT